MWKWRWKRNAIHGETKRPAYSLERIALELRRLDRQRRASPTVESPAWQAAVLTAYDTRLSLVCRQLGIAEYLPQLTGMDLELERLRVEGALQAAGFGLRSTDHAEPPSNFPLEPLAVQSMPEPHGEALQIERPSPVESAVRVVRSAVHILPAAHRERYAEEFASELYEIAAAGASRWRQMIFALRLLDRAWVLRAELHPPKRAPN